MSKSENEGNTPYKRHSRHPVKNSRLRDYLDNNTLPRDAGMYARGRINEHLCVFCDTELQSLSGAAVRYYIPIPELTVGHHETYCSCCTSCNNLIKKNAQMQKRKDTIKILTDLSMGKFRNDYHKYVSHNKEEDSKRNCCYGCGLMVDMWSDVYIDIPVDNEDYVSGGRVRVCLDCQEELSLTSGNAPQFFKTGMEKVCRECGETYTITPNENAYRTKNHGGSTHFMCPHCTHTVAYDEHYPYGDGDWEGRFRDLYCGCGHCDKIDITLHPNHLAKTIGSDVPYEHCNKCLYEEHSPQITREKDGFILRVYTKNVLGYKVLRRATTGSAKEDSVVVFAVKVSKMDHKEIENIIEKFNKIVDNG